jgi:hypothetical protein
MSGEGGGRTVLSFLAFFFSNFVCFLFGGTGVAAIDSLEAADGTKAGMVEGGFILRTECISRVIKFDSKQKNKGYCSPQELALKYGVPTSSFSCPMTVLKLSSIFLFFSTRNHARTFSLESWKSYKE